MSTIRARPLCAIVLAVNTSKIILIVHNIRSTHNVGSLLRTADGLGVHHIYFTGYTPYPAHPKDDRLPHLAAKINNQIHKTALGAEKSVSWSHVKNLEELLEQIKNENFMLAALEQTSNSEPLPGYKSSKNIALIVGNEVAGIEKTILDLCDIRLEIPMVGSKESFNVAVAASIAIYHLRFYA